MKRVLLVTLIAAVTVVLGAVPYWFGVEAERIYRHQISSLGASSKVTVLENRFERGWLRSYAESKIAVGGLPMVVLAEHTIEHGPIPVSAPVKHIISLRPMQALIRSRMVVQRMQTTDENLAMGTLLTRVNIDGTTRTQVNVPAGSVQFDPLNVLSWQQVSGDVDFDPAKGAWQGAIDLAGAEWREGAASIRIGTSGLKFLTYPGSGGLALGSSTLATESLEGQLPQSHARFIVRDVAMDSTASEQDHKVRYTLGGTMGSADFADLKIDNGDWKVVIEDLDLEALGKLNDMEVGGAIPLNDLMTMVSRHQARFESSLSLATHSGPFTASAKMRLSDSSNGSTNPLVLLSALVGSLDLDMPHTVVEIIARSVLHADFAQSGQPSAGNQGYAPEEAVSGKIQSWVNGNILTRQGDRYRFQATINNGAIQLNGKPFNLMSLLR